MEKRIVIIYSLVLSLIFFILLRPVDATCTPNYKCSDWSSCTNGISMRQCTDESCGGNITDRRLCTSDSNPSCTIDYDCTPWSQCIYFNKTNDLFTNSLKFAGYESHSCTDLNGCADPFVEEQDCSNSFPVRFIKVSQCGINFLIAVDPGTNIPVSKINLDAWRQQRLDISFVQSNFSYCPYCYNGFQDADETGVDCGGSCKPCTNNISSYVPFVISSWMISLLLFLGYLFSLIGDPVYRLRFALFNGSVYIERRDYERAKKSFKKIKEIYSHLTLVEQHVFANDLENFGAHLSELELKQRSRRQ